VRREEPRGFRSTHLLTLRITLSKGSSDRPPLPLRVLPRTVGRLVCGGVGGVVGGGGGFNCVHTRGFRIQSLLEYKISQKILML
jgi:hypothetical protein